MKTPRLLLLALWALLAPSLAAAAVPAWDSVLESADEWQAAVFTDENGVSRHYYFRPKSFEGINATSLYILTRKANPSVTGGIYYESVRAAYTLHRTQGEGRRAAYTYSVRRNDNGRSVNLSATLVGTLGASVWAAANPPKPADPANPRRRDTNTYKPGSVQVAVKSPGAAREELIPTPMVHRQPPGATTKWNDYYFSREPQAPAGRGGDPDYAYRQAKARFQEMHQRILPFEVMLNPNACYTRPEACSDPKKPEYAKYILAGEQSAKKNHLLIENLAAEAHAHFKAEADKLRKEIAAAPKNEFTAGEIVVLDRLLANHGHTAAFNTELAAARAKPATLEAFVKKWRTHLDAELTTYIAASDAAGKGVVDHNGERKKLADRLQQAVARPLDGAAPADKPGDKPGAKPNDKPGDKPGAKPGDKPGAKPEDKPASKPSTKPAGPRKVAGAGKWRESVTPVGEWISIRTSKLPILSVPIPLPALNFYCYHEKMDGDRTLTDHLRKHKLAVECVDWVVPAADATSEAGGKKFKTRNHTVQFDIGFKDGKLVTLNGVPGVIVTENASFPDALGGEKFVKLTAPASAAGDSLALFDPEELRWLTREQADNYRSVRNAAKDEAARKAADSKYREMVKEQTRPEAKATYAAAHALPKAEAPEKIKAAVGQLEMWGGKLEGVVGPFAETADAKKLEVQLSKAEYEALKKKPTHLEAYENARATINGESDIRPDGTTGETRGFNPASLDPVALHLSVEAARAALAGPAVAPVETPEGEKLLALLTPQEMEFLTPAELENYKAILGNAPEPKDKDANVQTELKRLRPRIESRKDKPYPKEGLTESTFDNAPDWQRDRFCNPEKLGGTVMNSGPKPLTTDLNTPGATPENLAVTKEKIAGELADQQAPAAAAAGKLPPWAVEKCKGTPFFKEPTPASRPADTNLAVDGPIGGGPGGGTTSGKTGYGDDTEVKEKEKNKWITAPLVTGAVKGGMVGLLVGSLFGPVGLIAGPLIGAALFYGITKITED